MKLPLKGIESNISPLNTNGSAQDVIGLRNKYGEWKQIPATTDIQSFPASGEYFYIHFINDVKYYWYYSPDSNEIQRYDHDTNTYVSMLSLESGEEFYSFIHFGNFLMVNTSLGSHKFIFDEGVYVELPDLPRLRWSVGTAGAQKLEKSKTNVSIQAGVWELTVSSMIQELINSALKEGTVQGHTLFSLAFETVTGEYILPTPIQYNYLGSLIEDDETNTTTYAEMLTYGRLREEVTTIDVSVGGQFAFPKISIYLSQDELDIINMYDGLIRGVGVFMTKPVYDYDINNDNAQYIEDNNTSGDEWKWLVYRDNNTSSDELLENNLSFYKIGNIDMIELIAGTASKHFEITSIETKEVLTHQTNHSIGAKYCIDYNDRIHLASVISKLADVGDLTINDLSKSYAYSDPQIISSGYSAPTPPIYAIVKLKIDNVVKTVYTELTKVASYEKDGDNYIILNPIVSYPDSRAFHLSLVHKSSNRYYAMQDSNGDHIEFVLKGHPSLNIAYSVREITRLETNYTLPVANDPVDPTTTFNIIQYYEIQQGGYVEVTPLPEDRYYQDKNRIQLSANSDPLSWPAINSYRIGRLDQEIKSLAVNTLQLSEGQFGEHPLFVFSESGLWALVKGQETIYSNIVPVSTDVILNRKAVPTKIGVVFATEKGIVVQSGRESLLVSQALDGGFKNFVIDDEIFTKLTDGTYDTGDLKEYLTGELSELDYNEAVLGYDFINDELYVSFPEKYTFIFNIKSKAWYKRKESWTELLIDGGHLLGITPLGVLQDINDQSGLTSSGKFIYVSNPVSLDNTKLKKYMRVQLPYKGENKSINQNFANLGVYIFGSNNLQEWKMIHGKRYKQTRLIELRKVRTSSKYHLFVIVGNQDNVSFNELDVEFI